MNTDKEQAEEKLVNDAFQGLISSYLASKHRKKVDIITRSFNFAKHAHKGIRRNSGEPYILHPIAVARIVCEEIGLGSTSICAALLPRYIMKEKRTATTRWSAFLPGRMCFVPAMRWSPSANTPTWAAGNACLEKRKTMKA